MTYVSNNDIYWVGTGFIDSLKYTNFLPYVKNKIPDQTAIKGELFNFTIPDSTFIDDDGNNTLIYNAKLTSGSPLPAWLTFDTITGTFTGTPLIIETLKIRVTATDTAGAAVFTDFKIIVSNPVSIETGTGQGKNIMIFPNPTRGQINISLNTLSTETTMAEIYNLTGKVIHKEAFRNSIRIDMTGHPKGIYFIKLLIEKEVTVRKICIQ
jgi:hypothetical protein